MTTTPLLRLRLVRIEYAATAIFSSTFPDRRFRHAQRRLFAAASGSA